MKKNTLILWIILIINSVLIVTLYLNYATTTHKTIPNLVGTWKGENFTISDGGNYQHWEKTIHITEQKGRRFRGDLTYPGGTKHFFGIVYPDNISFTWVSKPSHGYVNGRILSSTKMGACYVETFENAVAGCSELIKQP